MHIEGFRSLADIEFRPGPGVTVLLGANGAGQSNILHFFEMMRWMLKDHRLARFVSAEGGADDQLFRGSAATKRIAAAVNIREDEKPDRNHRYSFELEFAHPDRLVFANEEATYSWVDNNSHSIWGNSIGGYTEAELYYVANSERTEETNQCARAVVDLLGTSLVFQYHDTDRFRKRWDVEEHSRMLGHGENLAPVLLEMERTDPRRYQRLCKLIGRVLPDFDRFEIDKENRKAYLRWRAIGSEKSFGAHLTSDGSLRFFALATLLNLPSEKLPDLILLDEPELGLHPAAISLVAGLIKVLSKDKQVIVATQSPLLVDAFGLDEIVVLELRNGKTGIRNVKHDEYRHWLDEYSTGELWQKNLIGGRP